MTHQMAVEGRSLSKRGKVLISIGAAIVLISMLITGISILTGPRKLQLVVTMAQNANQSDREALKAQCGGLPGIKLVKDQGNPDPEIQGRFPVRFDLVKATGQQMIALSTCVNAFGDRTHKVRGMLNEGDQ